MRNSLYAVAAIAAISIGSPLAAEAEVKASVNAPKVEAEVKRDGETTREYKQEARIESPVKAINKADSLMGMEVRNLNDERLGEIKDIVIDWQSGKVGYIALAVGGFLGVGEKLVAIPFSALTPSDRSTSYLLMDATRGEIVDAPGFAATNWPDPRNPNYDDTPFFRPKNRGNAPAAESGNSKLYTDANSRDRGARVEATVDRDNTKTIGGRIKSINDNSVVVDSNGRTQTFVIREKSVRANDYKAGDQVTIKYQTENGRMVIEDLKRP